MDLGYVVSTILSVLPGVLAIYGYLLFRRARRRNRPPSLTKRNSALEWWREKVRAGAGSFWVWMKEGIEDEKTFWAQGKAVPFIGRVFRQVKRRIAEGALDPRRWWAAFTSRAAWAWLWERIKKGWEGPDETERNTYWSYDGITHTVPGVQRSVAWNDAKAFVYEDIAVKDFGHTIAIEYKCDRMNIDDIGDGASFLMNSAIGLSLFLGLVGTVVFANGYLLLFALAAAVYTIHRTSKYKSRAEGWVQFTEDYVRATKILSTEDEIISFRRDLFRNTSISPTVVDKRHFYRLYLHYSTIRTCIFVSEYQASTEQVAMLVNQAFRERPYDPAIEPAGPKIDAPLNYRQDPPPQPPPSSTRPKDDL